MPYQNKRTRTLLEQVVVPAIGIVVAVALIAAVLVFYARS